MKKRFFSAVTAAALTFSQLSVFPAAEAAESELVYINYGISNAVHIDVTDSNNEPVTASMKLIDSDGICVAKFNSDGTSCRSWNDSEIDFDPIDDEDSNFTVGFDAFKEFIPEGMELLCYNGYREGDIGGYAMADGETLDVTLEYKDPAETADLTVPAGTMGIYADSAIAQKEYGKYLSYYQINGEKYYAMDCLKHEDNIAYYSYAGADNTPYHGIDENGSVSASSPSSYTEDIQYIIKTMNVSDLYSNFTSDGLYHYDSHGSDPVKLTFDLSENTAETLSSFIIISGSMVNFVVPDENGDVTFYLEMETHKYKGSFTYHYAIAGDGYTSYGGSGFGLSGTAANEIKMTAAIPDFPENGVNMIKVPAGKYTLEFESLSSEYNDPGALPITINDGSGLTSISIRLKDYIEPAVTEPAPVPEGHIVYPEDNILNILVKNEDGELIPDAEMQLTRGSTVHTFDSGGTYHESNVLDFSIKWHESGSDTKYMFIPYEEFVRASGAENAFGMDTPSHLTAEKSPLTFNAGETRDVTLYLKDEEQETDLTLPAGYYGIYTDPKWAKDSSDCTSYLFIGDEPLYLNPDDGTGNYGGITTYYTSESLGPAIYAGICEKNAEPEQKKFIANYEVGTEDAEFVKHRMHVSRISEKFRDDGTYVYNDWVIDPRCNTAKNGCIILAVSEGMVSVVLPDEDGFVEFYAEKEERFCQVYVFLNHSAYGGATSRAEYCGIVASEWYTDTFTAVSLPDTGVVLTNVPEREYLLSFTSVPEEYRMPEKMTLNVEDAQGVQTIEIILQDKFALGDVDGDGDIDLSDAVLVLTHYAGVSAGLETELSDAQLAAADVNADGNVDLADASEILSYYSKLASGLDPQW